NRESCKRLFITFHVTYEVQSQSEKSCKKDERQEYLRGEERFIHRIVIIYTLVHREEQQSQVRHYHPELGKKILALRECLDPIGARIKSAERAAGSPKTHKCQRYDKKS